MENFSRGGDRGGSRGSFRNGGGKGGFKGGFKGGWKGGDRDSRPAVMHSAICSSCSKPCEVPFRPTGEKPVYCRDCFAGRAAMGGERSQRKDTRGERGNDSYAPQPRSNFNSNSAPQNSGVSEDLIKQINSMNVKLDKLTNTIQNLAERMNKTEVKEVVKEVVSAPTKIEEKMIAKSTTKKVSKKK